MADKIFACEICGCALDQDGYNIPIPEDWNPAEHDVLICEDCSENNS